MVPKIGGVSDPSYTSYRSEKNESADSSGFLRTLGKIYDEKTQNLAQAPDLPPGVFIPIKTVDPGQL